MKQARTVGYIGVDVLNNATICNEAAGLLAAGVPLDVVSVYPFDQPTYHRAEGLAGLASCVSALYPLGAWSTLKALAVAPWIFRGRFVSALAKVFTTPVEGWRQRVRLVCHFVPAVVLAMRWRTRNIGHIHAHWAHTATTIAMHAAELLGVGFSFTGHANDLFVHRVALAGKIRRARFTICISEFHRQLYFELGADPARLQVVYCGIDTAYFQPHSGEGESNLASRPRILGVGRLVEKKGFHDLIEACAVLRDRGLDFECVIAGSGPELTTLHELVQRNNLANIVTLTGKPVFQEELEPLIRSATVFALPCVRDRDGDMDGLPQVLIESMACGVPVVSTELVGIPDLVRDRRNGLLVPPNDPAALANALESVFRNPEWWKGFGPPAAEWARRHFDRSEAVTRLKALFQWAAETPTNSPPPHRWCAAPALDGDVAVATPSTATQPSDAEEQAVAAC